MAKTTVVRQVTIELCDFCNQECQQSPDKCGLCKRTGHNAHMAYALEVYRYRDGRRQAGFGQHVCQQCVAKDGANVGALLDCMIDTVCRPAPVGLKGYQEAEAAAPDRSPVAK